MPKLHGYAVTSKHTPFVAYIEKYACLVTVLSCGT